MSDCEVAVRVDGAEAGHEAGQEVGGAVSVTSRKDGEARGLRIRQVWRVHGRGNGFEEELEERLVDLPQLSTGMHREFPFRFTAPARPPSYRGKLLNVDHYVQAEVDIAWASNPRGEALYRVTPGPASAAAYLPGGDKKDLPAKKATAAGKALGWILLPVLVPLLLAAFAILLPILIVVVAVQLVRRTLAERRLGAVTAEIGAPAAASSKPDGYAGPGAGLVGKIRGVKGATQVLRPGEEIPLHIRFTPARDVELLGAEVKIVAVETAVSGSGKSSSTHNHSVWEKTVKLIEGRRLTGGQPVSASARVELPQTDAFSLDVHSNKVTWKATVRIDVAGWPDWVREHDLLMVPGRSDPKLKPQVPP